MDLYNECRLCICNKSDDKTCEVSDTSEEETDPELCDRVSQVDSHYSATSSKSSVIKVLNCKRSTLNLKTCKNSLKLVKRGNWLKPKRLKQEALAKELAKAHKMRMLAEADEAETLAKVCLEMVNIEAEEQLLACSESRSSIVALSKTSKTQSVFQRRIGSEILAKSSTTNRVDSAVKIERCPEFNFEIRLRAKTSYFVPVKLDQDTTTPNLAINRINDRTKRVNAWLNDETRQEAPLRIEPKPLCRKLCKTLNIATAEL